MKIHISVLILAILLAGCGKEAKQQDVAMADETVVPVKLSRVEAASRSELVRVSGTVASAEEARLSFKIGGIVSKIFVKEGQTVRKGQLLAMLDQTEIDAQVNQAQYSAEKSERDLHRVQNMLKDTAATLEQVQNATTGYDVAKQNLNIAKFNQSYSRIISPIDGTVTDKLINEGELTGPGNPGIIITSNRKNDWVVRIGVSDKDWARLKMGDKATVNLDAYPNEPFTGKVSNFAQAADPVSKLYEIEISIDPAGKRLASGLYAKVGITPSKSSNYWIIPVEALLEGNGKQGFVYVNVENRAKRIPVTIGYLDGDKVLISEGLDGISEVITAGSAFLTENSKVEVRK
ncbi:Multidrug resistance protein MexA [Dyadobacter sp. CECT 9275]|uniref:Multidrug resistance protein MexA n=1 Tax=Dyadobacter helix TaxID=2822344 RepID=A0A916JHB5_9BACT|nr:efflux RND transporter periplasmic adaptor subunit [Dyadobacter sp. CECT 9275]CAG5007339.1 Multidrug resistance protein MexA [Dyadobacter sp. CECT 9275]